MYWVFKDAVTLHKMHPWCKDLTVLFRLFALYIVALVVLGHTAYSVTRNTKLSKFATKLINDIEKHELLQNATKKCKILSVSNI